MITKLKAIRRWYNLRKECVRDARRFANAIPSHGMPSKYQDAHLESDIVRKYHVIEKGLSMPEFRPNFGKALVQELVQDLKNYYRRGATQTRIDSNQIAASLAALNAYRDRHIQLGYDLGNLLDGLIFDSKSYEAGGVCKYIPALSGDYYQLFRISKARCSVRSFNTTVIPSPSDLLRAMDIARNAPSVCNRQTCRVHAYTGEIVASILALQNGNRGFGHRIPMVLIITSDLRHFTGAVERNQGWIDGGLFAMMLLLGLHTTGIGSVALNWSVTNEQDEKLRAVSSIPEYERIIMLVGCGYPEEGALVPKSCRRSAESLLNIHT